MSVKITTMKVFDKWLGKYCRIAMIRKRNSLILNLTGLTRWSTHESKETKCRKSNSGWIKLPLDKSTKYDQNQAA
jgi:hypothetical protein